MSVLARVDRYQRRRGWLGFPLAVVYKFYDDRGPHLAAIITYYGFVSLFPLLLLFVTVLGFLLHGNPGLQSTLLHSALSEFPVVGPQIEHNVTGYTGSGTGLVIGILGTIYGGLGMTQAAQAVFNRVYAVPRNRQPNPFTSRLRSLLLLVLLGTGVLVTTGLSAMTTSASAFGEEIGFWVRIAALVFAFLVNVALFVGAFQVLTARTLQIREVALGGFVAAVGWQVLQSAGTYYLSHKLRHASEVYGVFGLVLGLLAWIYLEAMVVVLSAELNVVLHARLWPRSLLTPFTDRVELTKADVAAYTSYARSERYKGFEQVDVTFDHTDN